MSLIGVTLGFHTFTAPLQRMRHLTPYYHCTFIILQAFINKRPMGLDALLKNQLGHGPRFQKLHIHSISIPRGVKFRLSLLYGQRFPRHGPIFKIAIFGHETWQVAKVPELAHMPSFYPRGSKLS